MEIVNKCVHEISRLRLINDQIGKCENFFERLDY